MEDGPKAESAIDIRKQATRRDGKQAILDYVTELEAEIALHPEWPDLRHKAAVARALVKEPAAAKEILLPVVEAHPAYVEAARALAFAHLALGEVPAGIDVLASLEEKAGPTYAVQLARGLFFAAAGKRGAARAALEEAAGHPGATPLAIYAHAHACDDDDPGAGVLPRKEADAKHFQDLGYAAHDRQILGNPGRSVVLREVAARLGEQGDEAGSRDFMDLAFSLDLDLGQDAAARAELALARGKVDEAVKGFRRAIEVDPRAVRARSSLAYALVLEGDLAGAVATLEEAVRLRPAWADLRRQLGELLLDRGHAARAVDELRLAVELNAKYGAARFSLGRALLAAGDPEGAARELAAVTAGAHQDVAREVALALRARALLATGDLDGAAKSAAESIAIEESLAEPHLVLALTAERRGDRAAALAALAAYDERSGGESEDDEGVEAGELRKRLG